VSDYRNPFIAEAMIVLGYVNQFSRGVDRVQKELAQSIGITLDGIKYHIKNMTKQGVISYKGPGKSGEWLIIIWNMKTVAIKISN